MTGRPREDTVSTAGVRERATDRLVFVWEGSTLAVSLEPGRTFVVGRSTGADVRVDDASVSRLHARFHVLPNGDLDVTDLESRHGTRVDDHSALAGQCVRVPMGALVELGNALAFRRTGAPTDSRTIASPARKEIDRVLPLIAKGTISVLILGETGVGKEITAQEVHQASRRSNGPFVAIHCAALPESLLEAELFGYERGAFTGATTAKPGLFEAASGGTAFLDEITEIPLATQAKLLRAVETKSVMRLGALSAKAVDVRFVSAANRNVETLVSEGKFRDDLYYRLAGYTLHVPPLRARLTEVESLARRFCVESSRSLGREAPGISQPALACLRRYGWPGNIRELRNAIESAVLLATEGILLPQHLPARVTANPEPAKADSRKGQPSPLRAEMDALERVRILEALERAGGNQSRAARDLGMSRRLLVERLDMYGTPRPRKGTSKNGPEDDGEPGEAP